MDKAQVPHASRAPEPTTGSEQGSTKGTPATTDEVDRLIRREADVERLRELKGTRELQRVPRMVTMPERVDVGEHYVGSDHWVTIGAQLVEDGFTGGVLIRSTIEPLLSRPLVVSPIGSFNDQPSARSFLAETGPSGVPRFIEVENLTPLRVRYRPLAAGRHEEMLTVVYHWTDGRVTSHSVVLVGRAKTTTEIAEAPAKERPEHAGTSLDEPTQEAKEPTASDAAAAAVNTASLYGALDLVSDAQELGVDVARREAESYQKMPTPPPMWLELAKLAITVGTSGIANVLSRGVTSRIGEYLAKGDKAATDAFKSSNLSFALIDSLKDAMKRSAGAAVSKMATTVMQEGGGGPKPVGRDASASASSTNAFWQLQTRAVLEIKNQNQGVIEASAEKALKSLADNPQNATALLKAMDRAFRAAATDASAELAQTNASTQQWVTLVAQHSHGVELVGRSQRPVTEMVALRDDGPWTPSRQGVLQLEATIPWEATRSGTVETEHLRIHHARALGISQEIGERLANLPLRDVAVPILIVLNDGVTRITRDEAGRVRIDGFIPRFTDTHGEPKEADAIPTIREAFDRVFSRSLTAMGVKVNTDDASGLGDPAK